jgi:D-lactate dehydrogenase
MKLALFSLHPFERPFLDASNARHGHELVDIGARLSAQTAALADGFPAVSLFAHDSGDRAALERLAAGGTRLPALRSAGFNHVDLAAAEELGISVARVPAYSPNAIAEHAIGLLLTVVRKLHKAVHRTRELDFSLEGLMGFDLAGKTAGIVGTGKIGAQVARILLGFGCRVVAVDPVPSAELAASGVRYVELGELLDSSHVISLHCPLTPATRHLIDAAALARTKPGVVLVNTCRGAVVDTRALIAALKSRHLGGLALDVYEVEDGVFFRNLSEEGLDDDLLARLLTFPNVVVTAHQGFFTREAVGAIAETTLQNVTAFAAGRLDSANQVRAASALR